MPNHRYVIDADIQVLREAYGELQFWQKWIYPMKLKSTIMASDSTKFAVYKSYVDNVWFFQRWLVGCLKTFSNSGPMKGCYLLKRAHLLTEDNFNALAAHADPSSLALALDRLNTAGLLTIENGQANRNALVAHADPLSFFFALERLNAAGLLTVENGQANRNALVAHADPSILAYLDYLNAAGLLTGKAGQANFNALVAHADPSSLASALVHLNAADLLTGENGQANFDALVAHAKPSILAYLSLIHI